LVFPRNQIAFLSEMYNNGVEIVRGNETSWYFNCTAAADRTHLPRSLKLLDAFNPFARHPEPPTRGMTRSSGFVRFNLPRSLWHLHLARLKRPMRGGQPGIVHHYWWHPHNLGRNMDERISRLHQLLDVIADLIHTDKLKSLNMSELTKEARI
jgi:hypothetical protein